MISLVYNNAGCKEFVGSSPVKVQKNNLLNGQNLLEEFGPEYSIKLEVKFHSWKVNLGHIFRFQAIEGNCCEPGQRSPSMWTKPGSTDQIIVRNNIGTSGSVEFEAELDSVRLQTHKWYQFVFSQRKENGHYYFIVSIDGAIKVHRKNDNPTKFKNVKVYAGDFYYEPADAEIRHFSACQLDGGEREGEECTTGSNFLTWKMDDEIRVGDGKLIGIVPSWGPTLKINFELKILSFANCNPKKMANYLTFTATDIDCCGIGDMIPAFFTNSEGFLQLAMQINQNGNYIAKSPKLDENVWYKVEVEQFSQGHEYFFVLRASGREVFRVRQHNPTNYKNVKIYAAKYLPADAILRGLSVSFF